MRRLRYNVAVSLDGYIARANGGFDWIVEDHSIDFGALTSQFDTLVMGRTTYEVMRAMGPAGAIPGVKVVVCSTSLTPEAAAGARVLSRDVPAAVAGLKQEPGRDIWLFGGGVLFRSLLEAGLVDTVELAVMPVLLGAGIPALPGLTADRALHLTEASPLASGIVMLKYDVRNTAGAQGGTS